MGVNGFAKHIIVLDRAGCSKIAGFIELYNLAILTERMLTAKC